MPSDASLSRVIVRPEDLQLPKRPVEYIKFHGCAVLARDDPSYRPLLIARYSQISKWATQQEHRPMRKRLEALYSTRRTFMVGLSAQDANLQHVFGTAVDDLARPWSGTGAPAVFLSEETLHDHHENVLEITYGSDYDANADAIAESTVLGAFAKPSLLALVLSTLTHKLTFLLDQLLTDWDVAEVDKLKADLACLRDSIAAKADPADGATRKHEEVAEYQRDFTAQLVEVIHLALTTFRTGRGPSLAGGRYAPLSERPITQAVNNVDFPSRPFGRFGVALALVGRGHVAGHWQAVPGDIKTPSDGVMRLITETGETRVIFVKDTIALTAFELDDSFHGQAEETVVVIADDEPPVSVRSPRPRFGRNGKATTSRFNVASGVIETRSADELYEAFRLAGGF